MRFFVILAGGALLLAALMPTEQPEQADSVVWVKAEPATEIALGPPPLPEAYEPDLGKAVRFASTKWTQEIAVTNSRDRITQVPIAGLEAKWHVSGGMVGVKGWTSDKYKYLPTAAAYWVGNINVLNSLGYHQQNRGIRRAYPDGTEFHDVLRNDAGIVFEHRVRKKDNGLWASQVIYRDLEARPIGYYGLTQSCASCHSEAGTGKYAAGLVPGGDTVLSDPLDWNVAGSRLWDWRR